MRRYRVSVLVIILGFLITLTPQLKSWYNQKQQDELLDQYRSQLVENTSFDETDVEMQEILPSISYAYDSNGLEVNSPDEIEVDTESIIENIPEAVKIPVVDPKFRAIGIMKIDAIGFEQVIMPTASPADLNTSVGVVEGTGQFDSGQNICIAGHRSKRDGQNFNRLESLKVGDEIQIETESQTQYFEMTDSLVVEPDEVWVLASYDDDTTLTLITCTPIENPTHRYIVRAKLINP